MLEPVRFACANWVITPAALSVNEPPPVDGSDQRFLLILSGVVLISFDGKQSNWPWTHDTVHIRPDLEAPLDYGISVYSVPSPPGEVGLQYTRQFLVEQCAPFAGVASFESPPDVVAGAAADAWRPHHYETMIDAGTSNPLHPIFAGIEVDLAERAIGGEIHRVNYLVTLIGRIVFAAVIVT